jgi:hypothetical protein
VPKEQTVILVLQKEWVNTVAFLLNEGKASESTGKTHLLIGPFDHSDAQGVCVREIPSHQLTNDRSAVMMTVMVPWSAIIGVGIVNEEQEKIKAGFATGGTNFSSGI